MNKFKNYLSDDDIQNHWLVRGFSASIAFTLCTDAPADDCARCASCLYEADL